MTELKKIHLVFKTHLDIGFTDFAKNVEKQYFEFFIPEAMRISDDLRKRSGPERFVWTTGSWLIYRFLERSSSSARRKMERAIEHGDIVWHGLPFTMHSELLDDCLFDYGLQISRDLDRKFGKKTISAKMTDVPGHTRGIISILKKNGIELLHIGVNPACIPPKVPSLFKWRDNRESSITVMYNKGGYGGIFKPEGMFDALIIQHTNDNMGPPSMKDIDECFAKLRQTHPGATIQASTLCKFSRKLKHLNASLAVVEQEIGDTWIHGAGTDPTKVRHFREYMRQLKYWKKGSSGKKYACQLKRFANALLVVPEHTWGLDEKTHLNNETHFNPVPFKRARRGKRFLEMEKSWREQRQYLEEAKKELNGTPLKKELMARLKMATPRNTCSEKLSLVVDKATNFESRFFKFSFDSKNGSMVRLEEKNRKRCWASRQYPLAHVKYERFSIANYRRFLKQYSYQKEMPEWYIHDFSKVGLESCRLRHARHSFRLKRIWSGELSGTTIIQLDLEAPFDKYKRHGCPEKVELEYRFDNLQPKINLQLQWFGMEACRLPEAMWLSFNPKNFKPEGWSMSKMNEEISPLDVVLDGNRKLHAIDRGVSYDDGDMRMKIHSLDAPLVAPGSTSLLDFNNRQPNLLKGMHFNLYNNVWGTNFPMWFGEDALFRFEVEF